MPDIRHYRLTLCCAALLCAAPSFAATNTPTSSKAPVHISADHFRFDQQKGLGDYSGKVVVTQDKLVIKGDKLIIVAPNNGPIEKLTMTGAPASFEDTTADGKQVMGQAQNMEYNPVNQRITLTGEARVKQNGSTFRSARIVYDIRRDLVDAGAPGQRIEATFAPASSTTKTTPKP